MIITLGKQVHLHDLTQIRLIKQVLVLSKVTHVYIIFYLLHMKFSNLLTTVLKLEVFS